MIVDLIQYAIVANTVAVAFHSGKLDGSVRSWVLFHASERIGDLFSDAGRESEEFFAGARLKQNLVGHQRAS
nr:hypothetical protein [Nitrospira moscoviensis]